MASFEDATSSRADLSFALASSSGILQVRAIEPFERFVCYLTGDHLELDLRLRATTEDRTRAVLTVEGTFMWGMSRTLPRRALSRLHALCQTAADLT